MFLINIGGFLFLCFILSWYYKENIVTILPYSTGILIFLLYILAFFQKLNRINSINVCLILLGLILLIKNKTAFHYIQNEICSTSFAIMLTTYVIIFLCVKNKMITHPDELRVWGIEVKSIYFTNGFADKHKFTALGYADYFPGQMLFEWWTCHFSPNEFHEGLIYVGYYWLYVTFLMPILKFIEPQNKHYTALVGIIWTILILLFPGVAGTFGYTFLSAELLISVAFAYCLFQYIETQKHRNAFSIFNLIFCTMQLAMFKETGILYALLSLFFGFVILAGKKERYFLRNVDVIGHKGIMLISIASSIPVIIWKIYCKVFERKKYFDDITNNLITSLSEHNYQIDENADLYINSFFQALINVPLHEDKTIFLDMTVVLCISLILCLIVYIYKKRYLTYKESKRICLFYIISFALSSIALLYMHIFIFREEPYLNTAIMVISISRYLGPMFLGFLAFLFYFLLSNDTQLSEHRRNTILCMGIILLCTNYKNAYAATFNYRSSLDTIKTERENIIQNYDDIFKELQITDSAFGSRILYLESVDSSEDILLFRYLVAPSSLFLQRIASDKNIDTFKDDIKFDVVNNHCEYIFFDDIGINYLTAAFGADASYLENTLIKISVNENGDIIFNNVQ